MKRALLAGLVFVGVACEQGSHVFPGRRYLPERDCLEEITAVDVVEGPDPGSGCELRCLAGQSPMIEGFAYYVSTQCPPYPMAFDLSESSTECTAARAAHDRGDFCTADGSTNPLDASTPEPDSGAPDASASEDAGTPDAAAPDASVPHDAGAPDTGAPEDAGASDADVPDAD